MLGVQTLIGTVGESGDINHSLDKQINDYLQGLYKVGAKVVDVKCIGVGEIEGYKAIASAMIIYKINAEGEKK